jgi:hypothetical protein
VEVHIAVAQGGSAAKVLRAVLTRSRTANGDDEFTLTFEGVDSTDFTPYAIWVGAIKQWSFPAASLGRLSPSAAPPTEAPGPVRLAGGSDGSVTPPRPGVGVSGLAAKAGASETPLVPDAERAADELRARNDNLAHDLSDTSLESPIGTQSRLTERGYWCTTKDTNGTGAVRSRDAIFAFESVIIPPAQRWRSGRKNWHVLVPDREHFTQQVGNPPPPRLKLAQREHYSRSGIFRCWINGFGVAFRCVVPETFPFGKRVR